MRMRKKPNLVPRMERCERVLIKEPSQFRGTWLEAFPGYRKIYLELGCGKGRFSAEIAADMPDVLYLAVERVKDAMVVGMERACAMELTNIYFIDMDVSGICDVFSPGEIQRIYINFCDPWPSNGHAKRRLTAPGFLEKYRQVLSQGGDIHFKTDNSPLFDFSLSSFASCGFELSEVTRDLHGGGVSGVMTDYEAKFHSQGVAINRCVATLTQPSPPIPKAGEFHG